jgi:ATP-dependent Zn protease
MPEKTVKRRPQDAGDAALASDDDATVVATLVDAINRAIPTSTDSELKTEALRLERETAPRKMNPREVAYHEAGHAVVARNFGLAVMRVSINQAYGELFDGQLREGYMRLEPDAARHASLQRRLWIALAGPAAQERHNPDGYRLDGLVCARGDYECARKLYAELRGKPDCKAEDLASNERRARALVTEHWSAIEAVAMALLEHPRHSLERSELDVLLLAQRRN